MSETATYQNALQIGSMLLEYRLESVLGVGGFGMTYLGWDTHLEKHVAIKEYLPAELAVRALDGSVVPITTEFKHNYTWGLERFILEARTLAKFSHPHIVRVNRYFEANSTGYMVMDYEKGLSLNQILKSGDRPDEARLKGILMPLLDGLQAVHATGFLHRDIKPSNIFVRDGGSPVLIDFGASRQAIGGATKSLTSVLTPGYAPIEQYSGDGNQGPWSDVYAMAGVLYRAFVNDNPPDAVSRLRNDTVPAKLAALRGRVSEPMLRALEWALRLDEKQRPQSVQEWRQALEGRAAAPAPARMSAPSAPTVISGGAVPAVTAPPAPRPPTLPQARRPIPPPADPGPSGWRWVGIGLVLFVALLGGNAWHKQRQAERAAAEQRAAEQKAREAERLQEERRAAERRQLERQADPGRDQGLAELRALEQQRLAEERDLRLRQTEQRASEVEAALKRLEAERARDQAALKARPPTNAYRERPPREREERPGGGGDVEELRRKTEADFRLADGNGDGFVTREEAQGRMPFLAKEFQRVDTDGDGRVSPHELMQFRQEMLSRFRKP
jgi:serine/threonine protein kinase